MAGDSETGTAEDVAAGWQTIADPERGLALRVPWTTPSGAPVQVDIEGDAPVHRIHVHSDDGSEVYLEVVSFAGAISHAVPAADQMASLRTRSPGARLTSLNEGALGNRVTTTFEFRGELGDLLRVRRFVFVDAGGRTFRIVFDPTAPMNARILETLDLGPGD